MNQGETFFLMIICIGVPAVIVYEFIRLERKVLEERKAFERDRARRAAERDAYNKRVAAETARRSQPYWFHTALGITRSATADEIQKAYRSLAKKAHPDQGGSQKEMQRLNLARAEALKLVATR